MVDTLDGLRGLDQEVTPSLFLCGSKGFNQIQRLNPENLDIISIDECLGGIEKSRHILQSNMVSFASASRDQNRSYKKKRNSSEMSVELVTCPITCYTVV